MGEKWLSGFPLVELPRERMMSKGIDALSNAELIAILLRTGTAGESVINLAQRVLSHVGGLRQFLDTSLEELVEVKGIGTAKAVQLLAGIELGRRVAKTTPEERWTIRSPEDVAKLMMEELRYLTQEHFVCLFLNTKNQVIAQTTVFIGSLNSSIVHPREVFKEAVRKSSASLICLHNHPSGDPTPSREDIEVTKRLMAAGEIMGIDVLDHVIIGDGRYISLKEKGLI
ncbi:DNA repair protein RadC [Ammoniphilus sp. CFH 90114]|uniref:RadC family protein n=1 Tax=Ammoniphilus sp. CFH 90114 TaxID=2493665 RepID=UPI00100E3EC7|nr:DNA repair protein RadC [Ammoniphilus sp. CFH 90114]RXT14719.1 JAB domain-containing protein [Ammoniphilus sp. CFH 90114]